MEVWDDLKLLARFWAKVAVAGPDECWEWMASKSNTGYGAFGFGVKVVNAHRLSWVIKNKKHIERNDVIMHECDNKACVNPRHLTLGTHRENFYDACQKGRVGISNPLKRTCIRGHERTPENTYKNSGCRVCRQNMKRAWKEKNIDHSKEYQKKWREANREMVSDYYRKKYAANKAKKEALNVPDV